MGVASGLGAAFWLRGDAMRTEVIIDTCVAIGQSWTNLHCIVILVHFSHIILFCS